MSEDEQPRRCSAFVGTRCWVSGTYAFVARRLREAGDSLGPDPVLIFDDGSGRQMDFDLRGTPDEVAARYAEAGDSEPTPAPEVRRGPGRPRLGVVSKEVTLLPRHWAWLGAQRGGASATLRRLVDQARQAGQDAERIRGAQDAAYRFASAMAGNFPGFEEAMRSLYAGDAAAFDAHTGGWPEDVRAHARGLAGLSFESGSDGRG